MRRKAYACPNGCSLPPRRKQLREYNDGTYGFDFYDFTFCPLEMSRNVQSGNTQNLKSPTALVRLPAAPAPTPGTSQAAEQAGCACRS